VASGDSGNLDVGAGTDERSVVAAHNKDSRERLNERATKRVACGNRFIYSSG
jgi:hypothetical protein